MPETIPPLGPGVPASRDALRVTRPRWREPRLVLGVLLVLACVLLGARLLSSADSYVEVWSARRDLPAGSLLRAEDLQTTQIRFSDQAAADRYLASTTVPVDSRLSRPLSAGELVPRTAVQAAGHRSTAELPLGVADWALPTGLSAGDVVDVWIVPAADQVAPAASGQSGATTPVPVAQRVLSSVVVRSAGTDASALATGAGVHTVVVDVGGDDADRLPSVLPALASGEVVLIRLGA